jgi:dTDP-4-amino-4,6-dideoxygalactose transaminase
MIEPAFIPFHRPSVDQREVDAVTETLRSGWLTTGRKAAEFEENFREYTGARHALAVNSCTAALHLALAARGIGPGDEVITTPLTFCATVNTILHVGATPVLADIGEDGNIDPASIRQRLTPRTRAIVPVHLAGLACDMDAIWAIARKHGLTVIEDAAHAAGSRYRGHHLGSAAAAYQSDAVAYSFYATKNITTGEGGMVTSNDAELAEKMRRLCLHGISKDVWNRYAENGSWYYQVMETGFKYNLSDIQAALGIEQLRKLESFIALRRERVEMYNQAFEDMDELERPPDADHQHHSWHLYMLRLNLDRLAITRDEFIRQLHHRGIGCSVHFIPVPLHPFFAPWAGLPQNQCPKALALYHRIVSLPLYPALTREQVRYIARTVKDVIAAARKVLAARIA